MCTLHGAIPKQLLLSYFKTIKGFKGNKFIPVF